MDGITILHGDCREVMKTLDAGSVDAIVTDPPYGVANTAARARPTDCQRRAGHSPREWDTEAADVTWLLNLTDRLIIWGGNYYPLPPSRGWLVWQKPDAPPSMADAELAWTNIDANVRTFVYSISATNRERVGHPTQKPLALMRWCLGHLNLPPGSLILDPFAGSGTTAIACMKAGHRCIAIESDIRYIPVINRRVREARTPLFDPVSD